MEFEAKISLGYCQCGCGEKTALAKRNEQLRNYIKGYPMRFLLGHNGRKYNEFSYKINQNDCRIWKGSIKPDGYAQTWQNGKHVYAHRFVYEKLKGPIPPKLTLDHLCRNRACVNPDHLEPVSFRENVLRGIGPSAENNRKTHCLKGHLLVKENLEKWCLNKGRRSCKKCRNLRFQKNKKNGN